MVMFWEAQSIESIIFFDGRNISVKWRYEVAFAVCFILMLIKNNKNNNNDYGNNNNNNENDKL